MRDRSVLAQDLLRDKGLSVTKKRVLVLMLLLQHEDLAFTSVELKEKMEGKLHRATLYRILKTFEETQLVIKLPIAPKKWGYRVLLHQEGQGMAVCRECKTVRPVSIILPMLVEKLFRKFGYKELKYRFEIEGLCPNCQKKKKRK